MAAPENPSGMRATGEAKYASTGKVTHRDAVDATNGDSCAWKPSRYRVRLNDRLAAIGDFLLLRRRQRRRYRSVMKRHRPSCRSWGTTANRPRPRPRRSNQHHARNIRLGIDEAAPPAFFADSLLTSLPSRQAAHIALLSLRRTTATPTRPA